MHVSICRAPTLHRRQAVADGQAEVVVAVHGDDGLVDVRHVLLDLLQEVRELLRDRVAHGVRDVHGRRARLDALRQHPVDVLEVRARRVHRRELDVRAVLRRARHLRPRHLEHVLLVLLELVHDVDVRARQEDVDARVLRVPYRLPAGVDVSRHRARQAGDRRAAHLFRDRRHGFEVARRRRREPGLDEVDPQALQRPRDLQLLLDVQRDARRLLAVAQRRIENQYLVFVCHSSQPPIRAALIHIRGAGSSACH